ncbi:hypothetical protein NUW54_g12647 [Trametes sanguinea]|uniref:Uncharacterized protein n=1 Tax=Trametes sanguinea TaxID=158606 RepID=A0ACC1MX29_9APHY|nr:hypothetical protein NUW54_g12647 [Trametes sanguinea]
MGELSHLPSSINLRIDVGAASCIAEDERWWTPMDAVSMFLCSTCSASQGKCGSALWMWGPKVRVRRWFVGLVSLLLLWWVGCKVAAYLQHAWQLSCNVTLRRSSQQSASATSPPVDDIWDTHPHKGFPDTHGSAPFGSLVRYSRQPPQWLLPPASSELLLCIRLFGDPTSVLATWRRRVVLLEPSNLRTKFWGARAVAALWSIFATSPSVLRDAAALCTDEQGTLWSLILPQRSISLYTKGWRDDRLDKHFSSQRQRADRPSVQNQQYWYREMANIMDELDTAAEFIPKLGPLDFLDLG